MAAKVKLSRTSCVEDIFDLNDYGALERIMLNKERYGEIFDHEVQGKSNFNFRRAKLVAKDDVKRLFNYVGHNPAYYPIANRLRNCNADYPCMSNVCVKCMRDVSRIFRFYIDKYAKLSKENLVAVALRLPEFETALTKTKEFNTCGFKKSVGNVLRGSGFPLAFGIISYNISISANKEIVFPQANLLIPQSVHEKSVNYFYSNEYGYDSHPFLGLLSSCYGDNLNDVYDVFDHTFYRTVEYNRSENSRTYMRKRPLNVTQRLALTLLLNQEYLSDRLFIFEAD